MTADLDQRDVANPPRRSWFGRTLALVIILLVIVCLSASASWFLATVRFPALAQITSPRVIVLTSADGQALRHAGELRLAPIAASEMPANLVDAVLSIEDRRFYERGAVDFMSMLRALGQNLTAGRIVAGGSTITQQLVKTNFLGPERTYQRKISEAAISIWLQRHLSKDQILTDYLNSIYLGSGARGFPAAAKLYFNKSVADLSLPEAAMLAGLINAPEDNDPLHHLDAARRRAAIVLDAMVANGKLTEDQALVAKLHPATPNPANMAAASNGWFGDWVYQKALSATPPHAGAIQIRTTLDPRLQEKAAEIVKSTLAQAGAEKHASEAALVAMRPDGAVIAMVGGRSYANSAYNRAVQAKRQPGSAFKLFDYYAALRQGYKPENEILDAPVDIHGWQPANYGHRHHGQVTLADAFAESLNDATVRLTQQVGVDQVISAARDLGLRDRLVNSPSLALGTSEVTLLDLTSAYASVRAGKAPVTPWGISGIKIQGAQDYVSVDGGGGSQHSLGQYQAELLKLLQGVVDHGTGRAAKLQGFAAGKTGTTQDYRDAWFIGFNDSLITGVWVGNDDHSPMKGVAGGTLPATIWKAFMQQAGAPVVASPGPTTSPTTTAQEQASPNATPVPPEQNAALAPQDAQAAQQCNISACEGFYHSFRSSDCTYQPYSGGPRQYFER
ncbi:MAG: PBP1A family penicillin-binding protein [Acetobacteraceae bacterium]|nr:PBP1A family penicillin-binding protein [Acetobacteraceae bacterium]